MALDDNKIKKLTLFNKLGFNRKGYYEVYLVFGKYIDYNGLIAHDYHWYRQDKGGLWSHKPGRTPVTNKDALGKIIRNPAKANHNYTHVNYNEGGIRLWVKRY